MLVIVTINSLNIPHQDYWVILFLAYFNMEAECYKFPKFVQLVMRKAIIWTSLYYAVSSYYLYNHISCGVFNVICSL